jgi:hypothetical protein
VRSRADRAVDGDLAVVGVFAEQAADQRGLAGAVRADQRDPLAQPISRLMPSSTRALAEGLATFCSRNRIMAD